MQEKSLGQAPWVSQPWVHTAGRLGSWGLRQNWPLHSSSVWQGAHRSGTEGTAA